MAGDPQRGFKSRNLRWPPKLALGDGSLGFPAAMEEKFPTTGRQRCWVHKTANIRDKMPKSIQGKERIFDTHMADTRNMLRRPTRLSSPSLKPSILRTCDCLIKDREDLFTFYDFSEEHWIHIRTTNPI